MSLKSQPLSMGTRDSYESAEGAHSPLNVPTAPQELLGAWDLTLEEARPCQASMGEECHALDWNDLGYGLDIDDQSVNNTDTVINTPQPVVENKNPFEDSDVADAPIEIKVIDNNELEANKFDVVYELSLPVISNNFEEQWDRQVEPQPVETNFHQFAVDPFQCFNPLDVEGKEIVAAAENKSVETKGRKKPRPILPKLMIPQIATVAPVVKAKEERNDNVATPVQGLSTPAVESVLKKNIDQSGFDLLDFVTNTELPVNDPQFLSMIGDLGTSETPSLPADKLQEDHLNTEPGHKKSKRKRNSSVKPSKRAKVSATTTSTSDHAYMNTSSSNYDSSSTIDDRDDPKYRRMRDLNNLASKRCRANRKQKFQNLKDEEANLIVKNSELRMKCKHLDDLVARLKKEFIEKVSKPSLRRNLESAPEPVKGKRVRKQNKTETVDLDELLELKLHNI